MSDDANDPLPPNSSEEYDYPEANLTHNPPPHWRVTPGAESGEVLKPFAVILIYAAAIIISVLIIVALTAFVLKRFNIIKCGSGENPKKDKKRTNSLAKKSTHQNKSNMTQFDTEAPNLCDEPNTSLLSVQPTATPTTTLL